MQTRLETYDGEGSLLNTSFVSGLPLEEQLRSYRNAYIEQEITHNGKTVMNTKPERLALAGLELRWKSENVKATIKFKNVDGSISDASTADIQGLQKAMFLREQKGRDAEAVVLANHTITPYTDDSWKTDFDTEVA